MVYLAGGAAACVFAVWRNRETVHDVANDVQDTLSSRGETLLRKLQDLFDGTMHKVHEYFLAAAPPASLEAIVRKGKPSLHFSVGVFVRFL